MTSPSGQFDGPRSWRHVRIGAVVLATLALVGCTGGGPAASDPPSESVSSSADAPADRSGAAGESQAGTGEAQGSNSADRSGTTLDPPVPPASGDLRNDVDSSEALAAMPGLYGLSVVHTIVLDDRIEIESAGECATLVEVLQSGQWAVSARADGDGLELTLGLGEQITHGRLTETGSTCTGTVHLPPG